MSRPKGIVPGMLPPEPKAGDVIAGKFVVERVIGSGGMGKVLSARHRDLGTQVAIKIVQPLALRDPETLPRFMREARAMGTLKSEHTVRVYDVGETDKGLPYMIMEHLEGSDVSSVLREHGPLPVEDVLQIMLQASEALIEAHGAGIVHRDLKPQNLFMSRRTSGEIHVRVLDFGLAKPFVGVTLGSDAKVTRQGDMVGTTHYMAPEQIRPEGEVDGRTDIWAAGVCMFRLLTGRHPFAGQSPSAVCACILTDPPLDLVSLRSELPIGVVGIVLRCMSKPPEERYQTMRELRDALRDAIADTTGRTAHGHREFTTPGLDDVTIPHVRPPVTLDDASVNTTAHVPVVAPSGPVLLTPPTAEPPLPNEHRLRPYHFVIAGALGVFGALLIIIATRPARPPPAATSSAPPPSAMTPIAVVAPPAPSAEPEPAPIELGDLAPVPTPTALPVRKPKDAGAPKRATNPYDHM